jgi:hypothetical protein
MSAQETLSQILDREAEKLNKLSTDDKELLGADHLERLEALARCAKYLRAPTVQPKGDEPIPPATAADLQTVS